MKKNNGKTKIFKKLNRERVVLLKKHDQWLKQHEIWLKKHESWVKNHEQSIRLHWHYIDKLTAQL